MQTNRIPVRTLALVMQAPSSIFFFLLLFLTISWPRLTAQNCAAGSITLNSQAEVDDFKNMYGNCTTVTGYLTIDGDDIQNVDELDMLTHVEALRIIDCPLLDDLSGLSNLEVIQGDYLELNNLPLLPNIDDLSGLDIVDVRQLRLIDLPLVPDIGEIIAATTKNLMTLSTVQVANCDGLQTVDLSGFTITQVNGLSITNNDELQSLTLPADPWFIDGNGFLISDNPMLSTLNLGGLTSVNDLSQTGIRLIRNDIAILNIPNLTSSSGLWFEEEMSLTTVTLPNLTTLTGGGLFLEDLPNLSNSDFLANLTDFNGKRIVAREVPLLPDFSQYLQGLNTAIITSQGQVALRNAHSVTELDLSGFTMSDLYLLGASQNDELLSFVMPSSSFSVDGFACQFIQNQKLDILNLEGLTSVNVSLGLFQVSDNKLTMLDLSSLESVDGFWLESEHFLPQITATGVLHTITDQGLYLEDLPLLNNALFLSGLTTFDGYRIILRELPNLPDISNYIQNLLTATITTGGQLSIGSYDAITELDFSSFTISELSLLGLAGNDAITSFSMPSTPWSVASLYTCLFWQNPNLHTVNLSGLTSISNTGNGLGLQVGMNALTNLNISGLQSTDGLRIESEHSLTQITASGNLHTIADEGLYLEDLPMLNNAQFLSGLTTFDAFRFSLIDLPNFPDINSYLQNLITATIHSDGQFQINNVDAITELDFSGFSFSSFSIWGVRDNDELTSFIMPSTPWTYDGQVFLVWNNPKLETLDLSGLTTVISSTADGTNTGTGLQVGFNAITSLDLSNLTFTDGLRIEDEPLLETLDGMPMLTDVNGQLWVRDNPNLCDCLALSPLFDGNDDGATGPGPGPGGYPDIAGNVFILNNLPGCNSIAEVPLDNDDDGIPDGCDDCDNNEIANAGCNADFNITLENNCQKQLLVTDLIAGVTCVPANYNTHFQLIDEDNNVTNDWDLLIPGPGDYIYQVQVNDENGVPVLDCWGTFTAEDKDAPDLDCVSAETIELGLDGTGILNLSDVVISSSDNCEISTIIMTRPNPGPNDTDNTIHFSCADLQSAGDCETSTTVIVTVTATDAAGFVSTCNATITVSDPNTPQVTWPDDITLDCYDGFLNGNNPSTTDTGEPSASSCQSSAIGFEFEDEDAQVTATGWVINRNWSGLNFCTFGSYSHTQQIFIQDVTPPTAQCQDATLTLDANGEANLTVSQINNNSTDLCGLQSEDISQQLFTCSDVGTNSVILTVTDEADNTSTCTATVTVEDDLRPSITCPANATYDLSATECQAFFTNLAPTYSDNCLDDVVLKYFRQPPPGFFIDQGLGDANGLAFEVGETTVTYTVTDGAGNGLISACSFTVTVVDNAAPPLNCQETTILMSPIGTANLSANQLSPGISAICDLDQAVVSPGNFNCNDLINPDNHSVEFPGGGGQNTNYAVIPSPPLSGTSNFTLEFWFKLDAPAAGTIQKPYNLFHTSNANTNGLGLSVNYTSGNNTTELTLKVPGTPPTYTDAYLLDELWHHLAVTRSGNTTQVYLDGNPVITYNGPIYSLFPPYYIGAVRPTDQVKLDGKIDEFRLWFSVHSQNQIQEYQYAPLQGNELGLVGYWNLDEGTGNQAQNQATSGPNSPFYLVNIIQPWTGGAPLRYPVEVTLNATDINQNSNSCTSQVTLRDIQPPTANCADFTLSLADGGLASLSADQINNNSTDNCGIVTSRVDALRTIFNCDDIGQNFIINLVVSDYAQNTSQCTATVTIADDNNYCCAAPVALCMDYTVQVDANEEASITPANIDAGSTAGCGLQSQTVLPNFFDCNQLGTQQVTLTVTDDNNNTSTCTATVTVADDNFPCCDAPVATCQDYTIQLADNGGQITADLLASNVDNGSTADCGLQTLTVSPSTFNCGNVGANVVTLTITDNLTISSSCTATVAVQDPNNLCCAPPVAACATNLPPLQLDGSGSATLDVTAVNNGSSADCGIQSEAINPSNFDCSMVGDQTVTLTIMDQGGGTATCTTTVTVEDNTAPTIGCPANEMISGDANCMATLGDYTSSATLMDNCLSNLTVTQVPAIGTSISEPSTTVTLTVTEGTTSADCSFEVIRTCACDADAGDIANSEGSNSLQTDRDTDLEGASGPVVFTPNYDAGDEDMPLAGYQYALLLVNRINRIMEYVIISDPSIETADFDFSALPPGNYKVFSLAYGPFNAPTSLEDYLTNTIIGLGTSNDIAQIMADDTDNGGLLCLDVDGEAVSGQTTEVMVIPGANDYFWVGGSGDWTDYQNHWATSSGGTTFHDEVPGFQDNVYFDEGSGFLLGGSNEVNVDYNSVQINDMDWTGVENLPTLVGSGDFEIYGSLTFSDQMLNDYSGDVYFKTSLTGQTIFSAGQVFKEDVYFEGSGGWMLEDDFQVIGDFYFSLGTLHTNDKDVQCYNLNAQGSTARTLILGSSNLTLRQFQFSSSSAFTFDCGTSTISSINYSYGYSNGGGKDFYNMIFYHRFHSLQNCNVSEKVTFFGEGQISSYNSNPSTYNEVEFRDIGRVSGPTTIQDLHFQGEGTILNNSSVIHQAVFDQNGFINSNSQFGELTFSAGFTYTLQSGRTQTILAEGQFNAVGTPAQPIQIKSSSSGSQAIIQKDGAPICSDYLILTDINKQGTAPFYAGENSDNVNNNTGIFFEECPDCTPYSILTPTLDATQSFTQACPGEFATLVLQAADIGPDDEVVWFNANQTVEFYASPDNNFSHQVFGAITFYGAIRNTLTGCVSDLLPVQVECPCDADAGDIDNSLNVDILETEVGMDIAGLTFSADYLAVDETAPGPGFLYAFVLANDGGELLQYSLASNADFDFSTLPAGIYQVYGLSYDQTNPVQLGTFLNIMLNMNAGDDIQLIMDSHVDNGGDYCLDIDNDPLDGETTKIIVVENLLDPPGNLLAAPNTQSDQAATNLSPISPPSPLSTAKEAGITLFPNPNTGICYLVFEEPQVERARIQVFTSTGQRILERELAVYPGSPEQLDLSAYESGMYLVKILIPGQEVVVKRVVVTGR